MKVIKATDLLVSAASDPDLYHCPVKVGVGVKGGDLDVELGLGQKTVDVKYRIRITENWMGISAIGLTLEDSVSFDVEIDDMDLPEGSPKETASITVDLTKVRKNNVKNYEGSPVSSAFWVPGPLEVQLFRTKSTNGTSAYAVDYSGCSIDTME